MIITVNGNKTELGSNISVAEMVEKLNLDLRKIAIERNMEIVSRSAYKDTILNDGDKIEIIHFIGGG